jgi:hypothetical protein
MEGRSSLAVIVLSPETFKQMGAIGRSKE